MRTTFPFLAGMTIVTATMLGVAHAVGSDGAVTSLVQHALGAGADWIDAWGRMLWNALMQWL
jgi:hypothetical protein